MTAKTVRGVAREAQRELHRVTLFSQLEQAGLPTPRPEYQFAPPRRWSIDFAWPTIKLALEVEGGIYQRGGGGHRSISGFEANLEKYNRMAILGWRLLRATPEMVQNGAAFALLKQVLSAERL